MTDELSIDFSEPSEADLEAEKEEEAGFSGEEEGEPAEEEGSAKAIAEERGQELLDEEEEGAEEEEPERTPPPARREQPPPQDKPKRMTKEAVARLMKSIDLDELPEGEVIIGDTYVNLRELAEDDPEEFAAKVVLSGAIAEKTIEGLLRSGQLVSREQMGGIVEAINEQLIGQAYWLEVLQKHSDALDIKASDEFHDWIGKQSKEMKVLAASVDPKDGIALIDYYKESRGQTKRKTKTAPPRKRRARSAKKDVDLDDEQAGWDLGAKPQEWS
jgi:hypothetical protein